MTSIDLSEILDALKKTIDESELPFEKDSFFNELKTNITKDITPLLNDKNIKIIEKKQKTKEVKLSSENSDNLLFDKTLTNKDELKKIKVDTLKDYCKINGVYFKSTIKKPEIIDKITHFNSIDSNKVAKFFTINNENILYSDIEKNLANNTINYKNNNFHSNITKYINEIKKFSDDILQNIYYNKQEDLFISIVKEKETKKNYFVKLIIDSSFKLNIDRNYIIEIKQIKGSKDYIKVF